MTTGRYHYRSLFWPLMLIGIGVVWLLSNMGVLSMSSLAVLFRLWPLILIVIGLDLLFGRQSPALGGLLGLGAVILIIGLMIVGPSLGWAGDVEIKTGSYSEPLGDAASARVNLGINVGEVVVKPLTDSNNLLDANVKYMGDIEFKTEGQTDKFVSLSQDGDNRTDFGLGFLGALLNPDSQLRWDVGLNANVPLDLTVNTGVGAANLDLSGLKLTALTVNTGTGSLDVSLPNMETSYNVTLGTGTGGGAIRIPEGAALTLGISAGTGGFTVDVPDNAAVRVEGSTGTGDIDVLGSMTRIGGKSDDFVGDKGTWETEGFASAPRQIVIRFDGGTGGLTVR